jgi:protein-S-isoprenylcysteine O-methyltransferase Ste14
MLDIRWPIGLMFSLVGVLLVLCGLVASPADYQKSLGINIDLIWGLVLLIFGALMLALAWKDGRAAAAAEAAGSAVK